MNSLALRFPEIFPRVSKIVKFKGSKNSREINKRITDKINEYPRTISPGWVLFLQKLVPWFGVAAIDDARANPHGYVAQTLRHGREAAEIIMDEQARQYLKQLRRRAKQNKKYRRKK